MKLRSYRIRRNRRSLKTLDPARYLPTPAHVLAVTASYGDDFAIFTFDEPLAIEADASFDMFYLSEAFSVLTGTAGVLLDPYRLKITFDAAIVDTGAEWSWTINPGPEVEKIHTVEGEDVEAGNGVVTF
ncbi:MAG TPA: hypothetical protein VF669_04375 [Tepidisphaeraceae bacterium]|jgi:hypothetical protein